jgi:heat shock protein HslJ
MNRSLTLSVGLLAVLTACASVTPAAPSAPAAPLALEGTSWVVTSIRGAATLADAQPTMQFADGKVAGLASCNRYFASFAQKDATLTFGQAGMTMMMCTRAEVMTQEQAFSAALPAVAAARTTAAGLDLTDSAGTALLALAPAPKIADKPLEGTAWKLSGIVANEAVSSPVAGSTVTMTINDGTLSGKACNTFRGTVTAANGTFAAGPLMSTKMACTSAGLTAQETAVLANLQAATGYAIAGDTLTLSGAGGTGLVFTAA